MHVVSCRIFLLLIMLVVCADGYCQKQQQTSSLVSDAESIRQRRQSIKMTLDTAALLISQQQYRQADDYIRYLLNTLGSVPSDLVFLFGKNSFLLGKYAQSIDWLSKYIQLKGEMGEFYKESVSLKKQAEEAFTTQQAQEIKHIKDVLSGDFLIDCSTFAKIRCSVCRGTTVIIRNTYLGNVFKTCPFCDEHGLMTCEQYNNLIKTGSTKNAASTQN